MSRVPCVHIASVKQFLGQNMRVAGGFYPSRTIVSTSKPIQGELERLFEVPRLLLLRYSDTLIEWRDDAFTHDMAGMVANHLQGDDVAEIVISCDAGESRSPALAAALFRHLGASYDEIRIWKNPRYHPNMHVYKTMCQAWNIDVSDDEITALSSINEQVFMDQVNYGNSWPHDNE